MTESREVLIDAMLREWYPPAVDDMAAREDAMGRMALMDMSRLLDTLLAHPSAVLAALENAPCQTCGGDKFMRDAYGRPTEDDCSACGGSGKLGRDGVLRALGMEQVGWARQCSDDELAASLFDWQVSASRTANIDAGGPAIFTEPVYPVAVRDLLENAPCETCGGKKGKFESRRYGNPGRSWDKQVFVHCPDCGGSGRLGRDGVLRALGMEQVGWTSDCRDGDFDFYEWTFETRRRRPRGGRWVPAFASRAAVSDTKEWEK